MQFESKNPNGETVNKKRNEQEMEKEKEKTILVSAKVTVAPLGHGVACVLALH